MRVDYEKLQLFALNKGLSVSRVCEKAGLSRSRGTDLKNRNTQARTIYKIAKVLDVKPSDLLKEAE